MRRRTLSRLGAACALGGMLGLVLYAPPPQAATGRTAAPRIGVLMLGTPQMPSTASTLQFMNEGLRQHGLEAGRDYVLDVRYAHNDATRLGPLANELAASRPALMYAGGNLLVKALVETPGQVSVVGIGGAGLLGGSGNARQPGGRATGMTVLQVSLNAKRAELLAEMCPRGGTLAHLGEPQARQAVLPEMAALTRARGLQPLALAVNSAAEVDAALTQAADSRACGVNVLESTFLNTVHAQIIQRAREHRLPAIYQWPEMVNDGALMAYGPSRRKMVWQAMGIVARVLRGESPGRIPIEMPLRFELHINMKLAREMGVSIPPALLARADDIVE